MIILSKAMHLSIPPEAGISAFIVAKCLFSVSMLDQLCFAVLDYFSDLTLVFIISHLKPEILIRNGTL